MGSYKALIRYLFSLDCLKSFVRWSNQQNGVVNFYERYVHIHKNIADYDLREVSAQLENIGILIQGPIWDRDNFTIDSIKLYRSWYPNVIIVLVLWERPSLEIQIFLNEINVEVLVIARPKNVFRGSLGFQLALISAGLVKIRALGATRVAKLRADQRMLDPMFLCSFQYYSELFCNYEGFGVPRLLFTLHDSIFGIPFKMGDQIMYGDLDELIKYWDSQVDDFERYLTSPECRYIPNYEGSGNETWLYARYIHSINPSLLANNILDYRKSVYMYVSFLDSGSAAMLWAKYPLKYEPHYSCGNENWRQWRWFEWFNGALENARWRSSGLID